LDLKWNERVFIGEKKKKKKKADQNAKDQLKNGKIGKANYCKIGVKSE